MRLDTTKTEVDGAGGYFLSPQAEQGLYANDHDGIVVKEKSPEYNRYMREFFHREPCIYNHTNFQRAALIYHALRGGTRDPMLDLLGEKPKEILPTIEFEDENEKRLTFSLVFQTLKCK